MHATRAAGFQPAVRDIRSSQPNQLAYESAVPVALFPALAYGSLIP